MTCQQDNIRRVSQRISRVILDFYDLRKSQRQPSFHAGDLRFYVARHIGHELAPASPDRILRDLRKRGLLDYKVVSRSQSMYEFQWSEQPEFSL